MTDQNIKISAEPGANPKICRFVVDHSLAEGRKISCRSADEAAGSPLLEALFAVDGVREVLIAGDTVTVAKFGTDSWQILGSEIGAAIRSAIESGKALVPDDWGKKPPSEEYIYKEVEQILASRINPGVSTHGGHVDLVDVKGTAVYLRLGGGCQGCGAANVTLRQGIEKQIKARIPQVTEVVDVTDHTSGKNPFYKKVRTDGSPLV